jgi:hypothetical protein
MDDIVTARPPSFLSLGEVQFGRRLLGVHETYEPHSVVHTQGDVLEFAHRKTGRPFSSACRRQLSLAP